MKRFLLIAVGALALGACSKTETWSGEVVTNPVLEKDFCTFEYRTDILPDVIRVMVIRAPHPSQSVSSEEYRNFKRCRSLKSGERIVIEELRQHKAKGGIRISIRIQ